MASMYFPIKNHGGIPNMLAVDGSITIKKLVKDTCVGKKKAPVLPHLIANTVDDLARGRIEPPEPVETIGEPSVLKRSSAGKLVKSTKTKVSAFEELTPEEHDSRRRHKRVAMRMRQ